VSSSTCDREERLSAASAEPVRPTTAHGHPLFPDVESIEEQNRQANDALKIWRADLKCLEDIEDDAFNRFGAFHALRVWRDKNPTAFLAYAAELLDRAVVCPAEAFHIGGFIAAVVDALVPLNPERALAADEALRNSSLRVHVINEYGASSFQAALWRHAGEGNERCQNICRRMLKRAATDSELMSQSIIAQAENALPVAFAICDELLGSSLARDRVLAISVLAWIPDDLHIDRLTTLAINDPSGWVRSHAAWASEVAQQERGMRHFYSNLLQSLPESDDVRARLRILLPALTPSALWWHRSLEDGSSSLQAATKANKAALRCFWYDVQSHSKKPPKAFGRELTEYLRGERVRDLRVPRPRLVD
jgi:hypothetical protein